MVTKIKEYLKKVKPGRRLLTDAGIMMGLSQFLAFGTTLTASGFQTLLQVGAGEWAAVTATALGELAVPALGTMALAAPLAVYAYDITVGANKHITSEAQKTRKGYTQIANGLALTLGGGLALLTGNIPIALMGFGMGLGNMWMGANQAGFKWMPTALFRKILEPEFLTLTGGLGLMLLSSTPLVYGLGLTALGYALTVTSVPGENGWAFRPVLKAADVASSALKKLGMGDKDLRKTLENKLGAVSNGVVCRAVVAVRNGTIGVVNAYSGDWYMAVTNFFNAKAQGDLANEKKAREDKLAPATAKPDTGSPSPASDPAFGGAAPASAMPAPAAALAYTGALAVLNATKDFGPASAPPAVRRSELPIPLLPQASQDPHARTLDV